LQTAHSNACKSTRAVTGVMLASLIEALHFGQMGRSKGAGETAEERDWGWGICFPGYRREHNTLCHRHLPGAGR